MKQVCGWQRWRIIPSSFFSNIWQYFLSFVLSVCFLFLLVKGWCFGSPSFCHICSWKCYAGDGELHDNYSHAHFMVVFRGWKRHFKHGYNSMKCFSLINVSGICDKLSRWLHLSFWIREHRTMYLDYVLLVSNYSLIVTVLNPFLSQKAAASCPRIAPALLGLPLRFWRSCLYFFR